MRQCAAACEGEAEAESGCVWHAAAGSRKTTEAIYADMKAHDFNYTLFLLNGDVSYARGMQASPPRPTLSLLAIRLGLSVRKEFYL